MNKSILSFEKERILVSASQTDVTNGAVPSPVLAECYRVETVPFVFGTIYSTSDGQFIYDDVYDMNRELYTYVRGYISDKWSDYYYDSETNPNPIGWVYLESVDTEISSSFDTVNRVFLYAVHLSARIVFYNDNNVPSTSPSGV